MSIALDMGQDYLEAGTSSDSLKTEYLNALTAIERLHRLLLDVIKDAFEREGGIEVNAVQALLLFNIGTAELTAGELRSRGYYLGSNVSYNLKKLVDSGFIHHKRSETDKRSVRISLTSRGLEVCRIVSDLYRRQMATIEKVGDIALDELDVLNATLRKLERYWADQIRYRL